MKSMSSRVEMAGSEWTEKDQPEKLFLDWRVAGIALAVFAAYYAGCKIGFALTFQPHPVSVLWPPNSILLAALLLTPVRLRWMILLAAFPAHLAAQLQSEVPPVMILCWFISNSCEALIGAGCVRYLIDRPVRLDRLRNVAVFCFGGAFLGPFLSSFLDTAFVVLNNFGGGSYWELWRIRFTSNVLAALTLAPLLVTWCADGFSWLRQVPRSRLIEAALLLFGLLAAGIVIFNTLGPATDSALLYLPLPFLLWAAVRFGARGATAAVCIVAFFAIWSAGHGYGPFSLGSPEQNALSVQIFLTVVALPLLFLSALIEERAQVEATLLGREARIHLAAESANLAFWTVQLERKEAWMSDNGRAIFNFEPNEPLSLDSFLSRVHPEDRDGVEESLEGARVASGTFEVEYRLLRPDGETRWLISRGRYLRNAQSEISELIGVAIDVTAQVKANFELRLRREELAHMSRVASMGELTGSLAHELNQPLTAIASNAAAGKRILANAPIDVEMFQELLADVSADAHRAGNIIHGIHQFVRKSEGTRSLLNLNDIIREVLRLLHSDLLGRATSVETQLAPDLPQIEADPVLLQQALLNLVMNSLEAMHGRPAAERGVVIATARQGNSSVLVSVRDRGCGLPAGNPDQVFTHFYSTKPNGMGMGLTIVRSIVEAHGGELGAENVEDGARFFFNLPLAGQTAARART